LGDGGGVGYFCVPMKFSRGFPTGSSSSWCVPQHVPNSSSIYAIISFCQKKFSLVTYISNSKEEITTYPIFGDY